MRGTGGSVFIFIVICVGLQTVNGESNDGHPREKRQTPMLDVRNCAINPPYYPSTTFLSDIRLAEMRRQMQIYRGNNYHAYIIPGWDAHGSEYAADPDKRIWYMNGFNGTGGVAIVTRDRAAVWTDKRYELLARQQIDCNWGIHVIDDEDYLTPWQWLLRNYDLTQQELLAGELRGAGLENGANVGFDPMLMPYGYWYELQETDRLEPRSVAIVPTEVVTDQTVLQNEHERTYNLVDRVRIELVGRQQENPPDPRTGITYEYDPRNPYGLNYRGHELFIQDKELYAGLDWQDKIYRRRQTFYNDPILYFKNVRELMSEKDVDVLVITKLDEIAWLFNLRGEDIPYHPLFISFAIIGSTYINLYLYDSNRRLDPERYELIREHLELDTSRCQSGTSVSTNCVIARNLDAFKEDLKTVATSSKIWFSNSTNYFVYKTVLDRFPNDRTRYLMSPTPIALMKAVKNEIEVEAMKKAFLADSIATIEVAAWMNQILQNMVDPKVGDERSLTEWMVVEKTETYRESHATYRYPAYYTISAIGEHSADYYYISEEDDRFPIQSGKMFMYDIGGQYREGTTTLSRTFFFAKEKYDEDGNVNRYEYDSNYSPAKPTDFQKEVYTRALLGLIDFSNATFHTNVYGRDLDSIARQYLWDVGLDYFHPTGFGIGQYLTAHEGPIYIKPGFTVDEQPFNRSMFVSAGPGYYHRDPSGVRENDFGLRLANVLRTIPIDPPFEYLNEDESDDVQYMRFETVTLVPFEPRLIKFEYFTRKQLDWYNKYNQRLLDELSGKLSGDALEYLKRRTRFQRYKWEYIGAASTVSMVTTAIIVSVCSAIAVLFSL